MNSIIFSSAFTGVSRTRYLHLSHNSLVYNNTNRTQNFFHLFKHLEDLEQLDLSHNSLNLTGGLYLSKERKDL